jgi:hypothetical protein
MRMALASGLAACLRADSRPNANIGQVGIRLDSLCHAAPPQGYEYLSQIKYEVDVLSLPIEQRRKIQRQKLIAEYLLKAGKADIDGVESICDLNKDDGDYVEIEGVVYKID